ncbi:DNA modification methylase [Natronosalvus rutilus]|uniref:DNA modification methylase n=1 Tax=Natronosalvus rutilus TaxID=2953753 RepID=A0A9E7NFM2_9EURY|nr:DNA modification methylase [Natronosalvus rutilus]UTF56014.1 DNA modification methylase [Natronosalvus rutilus]
MKLTDLPGPDWEGFETAVGDLHVDGDNPNEMDDEMFTELVNNIRKYGWVGPPILADADGLISDGEHRLKAADEIGLEEVPVLGEDLSEADRRMLRLKMNKIHGEHEDKADALEYDWLVENGRRDEVLDMLDARDESLDEYLDMIRVTPTRDNPPTPPPQPEVFNEDCVDGMADRLEDDEVDLIVTDPPYGVNIDISDSMGRVKETQHLGTVANDHDEEEALELWDDVMTELDRVASTQAHLYCFASWKTAGPFRDVIEAHGWQVQNYLVWVKKDASQIAAFGTGSKPKWGYKHEFILFAVRDGARPLDGYPDDVLEYTEARWSDVEDQETIHPTQKPVALLEELIERSSERGDLVIDPFGGSGATGEAAVKLGRETRLWELEEAYIPVIERRIHTAKRQRDSPQNADVDGNADGDGDAEGDGEAPDEEVPADA